MAGNAFTLSQTSVDLGRVSGSGPQSHRIQVALGPAASGSLNADPDQPWLTCRLENLQGRTLDLVLVADPARLAAGGSDRAVVTVRMAGQTERIDVRARAPQPAGGPGGGGNAGAAIGRCAGALLAGLASGSLALALLAMAAGALFLFTLIAGVGEPGTDTEQSAAVAAACVLGGYLLLAFARGLPLGGRMVRANSPDADSQRLGKALADACTALSVPRPWLALRPGGEPNVRSFGILGPAAIVHVRQGLLTAVPGEAELTAVLAHEVAHLRRFDTLFFTVVGPLVELARLGLGLAVWGTMLLRRVGGGLAGAFSPGRTLAQAQRGGAVGCIVMMAIVMAVVFIAFYLLLLAGVAVAGVALVAVCGLAWSRHAESAADECAARALGSADGLLAAMAWCVDFFPSQRGQIEQFMMACGGPANYGLADVIRCLRAGGRAPAEGAAQRLLTTHPPALARIARLVARCGTRIA